MATHSSVLAWRIPGTAEPGRLLSMGSHRVGHDWSDLAAAAAAAAAAFLFFKIKKEDAGGEQDLKEINMMTKVWGTIYIHDMRGVIRSKWMTLNSLHLVWIPRPVLSPIPADCISFLHFFPAKIYGHKTYFSLVAFWIGYIEISTWLVHPYGYWESVKFLFFFFHIQMHHFVFLVRQPYITHPMHVTVTWFLQRALALPQLSRGLQPEQAWGVKC